MTLLQRDREKQEEGALLATRIIRLHLKGMSGEEIALSVHVDQEYVNSIIADFEKE